MTEFNKFDYSQIPGHTKASLDRYINQGVPTGDFLRAVLCNDLFLAIQHADGDNVRVIPHIVCYLYNECPTGCYGSAEKVNQWMQLAREQAF